MRTNFSNSISLSEKCVILKYSKFNIPINKLYRGGLVYAFYSINSKKINNLFQYFNFFWVVFAGIIKIFRLFFFLYRIV